VLAALCRATAEVAAWDYAEIGALPLFNQDLYVDPLPASVASFREQIAAADGIVIVSPEYNHGIPGVLKNALDWASRPHNGSPLRNKPALIATSSHAFTGGVRAQCQIRETLVSALARPISTPEIVVGLVAEKIVDGQFEDAATIKFALDGFAALFEVIGRKANGGASQ
jgi:chromate reductase